MKLVLIGYMASGKSTIGKLLAKELGIAFYDLDNVIAKEVGLPILEIFKNKGELFFRKTETQVLRKLLDAKTDSIIATGGGTPCYGNNMHLINEKTTNSFYLKLTIPSLIKRLTNEKDNRPLVADILDKDLPEFIGKHLFERSPFYSQANYTIQSDAKKEQELVKEIKDLYAK